MKTLLIATSLLTATALPAAAEVYRCSENGKPVYTDRPCHPGAAAAQLPPLTPIDRQPTSTPLTRQFDAEARADASRKRQADAEWSRNYAARKAHDEGVRSAIIEHRLIKGMTMDEVRRSIGEPTRIDGEAGDQPHWTYQNGRERRTLVFAGGVLKSDRFHTSRRLR